MIHLFVGASIGTTLHPGFHVPAQPRAWSLVFATPTRRGQRVWAARSFLGAGCGGAFSFTSDARNDTNTESAIVLDDAAQAAAVVSGVNAVISADDFGDSFLGDSFPPTTPMSGINHDTAGRHEFDN